MAALTVRQVGQVAPPLKQKVEQFQQIIDNNDQSVARIREQLRRLEPQRERLSDQVQQRQDDRRSIHSQLARLEDSLASFGAESVQLEAAAEEMPRLLERIAPVNAPGAHVDPSGFRRLPAAAIDVPLPYFDALAEQLEARTKQVYERVNAVEKALATYNRQVSGVPVTSQIEARVQLLVT
ncbi:npp-10, partial [Symbiodinium necroappetens]